MSGSLKLSVRRLEQLLLQLERDVGSGWNPEQAPRDVRVKFYEYELQVHSFIGTLCITETIQSNLYDNAVSLPLPSSLLVFLLFVIKSFANSVLKKPSEPRPDSGFSVSYRCSIAFTSLWFEGSNDEYLVGSLASRLLTASDRHVSSV